MKLKILIPGLKELWIKFGKGTTIKHIPVHQIARSLWPERSRGLPGFHSLTGCDSNSAFYGVGKKRAWSVWQEFPEATNAPMHISTTPEEVHARIMAVLEELVVRMYSSSLSAITSVNKARFEMFHYGGKDFDHIPRHRMPGVKLWSSLQQCRHHLCGDTSWRTRAGSQSG